MSEDERAELEQAFAKARRALWDERHYLRAYLTGAGVGAVVTVIVLTIAGRLTGG